MEEEKRDFASLGLDESMLKGISAKGFEEPTAIQRLTIPILLEGTKNIIAQAHTGTGKTAAFGLPLIQLTDVNSSEVQALILVPTRELAIQVCDEINSFKGDKDLKIVPIYGGQSIEQQLRRLRSGVHIVVGTPGRVIDHLGRKTLHLNAITHLILDEADEMLNMGFIEDIEEIIKHTSEEKKTLLFSATMPERILQLASKYMNGYEKVHARKEQLTANLTEQIYFEVKSADKFEALCRIIDIEDEFYSMVFCRTKSDTDMVATRLIERGYDAEAIHGDIAQAQREKTLDRFRKKKINILVATDVAARGIDVSNLTHVINFSLPEDPDSYVHRIGRTGRAGNEGTAITFITPSEYKRLMFIQRVAKADIKKSKIPSVAEIIRVKKQKIHEDLIAVMEEGIDEKFTQWAKKLLEEHQPEKILSSLLAYCFEEDLNPQAYGEVREVFEQPFSDTKRGASREREKSHHVDQQGKARLFVALGKQDKIDTRKLMELIMSRVSIKRRDFTDIQVMDKFSFITVPFEKAEKIVISFREKGQKPLVTRAKD